jgi:Proteasome maturation factor UMP1
MSNQIPMMRTPANSIVEGPNSNNFASQGLARHPVDEMQQTQQTNHFDDLDEVRRMYGSGLAMRLATERQMALNVGGRLPGMDAIGGQSNIMFETLMGTDTKIEFGDFMGRPEDIPTAMVKNPHSAMETKLGL